MNEIQKLEDLKVEVKKQTLTHRWFSIVSVLLFIAVIWFQNFTHENNLKSIRESQRIYNIAIEQSLNDAYVYSFKNGWYKSYRSINANILLLHSDSSRLVLKTFKKDSLLFDSLRIKVKLKY